MKRQPAPQDAAQDREIEAGWAVGTPQERDDEAMIALAASAFALGLIIGVFAGMLLHIYLVRWVNGMGN